MKNIIILRRKFAAVISAFVVAVCCLRAFPAKAIDYPYGSDEESLKFMAERVIVLVNEARAEAGLEPLYMVPYICDMAMVRSREIIFDFSHIRSENGENFASILDTSLVPYMRAAENIAAGTCTPEDVFEQWKNSPNHWKAIINPNYTHMGVGVAYDENSTYKWYWEQLFVSVDGKLDGQYIPERYKTVPASSGDINGDKDIDAFDVITINRYLAGEIKYINDLQLESADMLKDGVVTSADIMVLKKYILGEYKTLPMTIEDIMGYSETNS